MAKGARYRRWRDDIFGHPKTGGMTLTAYGLMQFAGAQNILGVLQMSPRAIAVKCGAMQVRTVTAAIAELTSPTRPGLAMWWEELETLWIVEALDEQSDGPKVDASAAKLMATLPPVVQAAIVARYGRRVGRADGGPTPLGTLFGGVNNQESGDRNQEQESGPPPPSAPVVAAIVEHRQRLGLTALTKRERDPRHIEALLDEGVSLADLLEVVEIRAAEAAQDETAAGYFDCVSPFTPPNRNGKPGGWSVSRGKLDRARRRGHGGPKLEGWTPAGGITDEELDARFAEDRRA